MRSNVGASAVNAWFTLSDQTLTRPGIAIALCLGMITILLVILILMLLGAIPAWPHSRGWGYYPSSTLGLVILIVLLLALTGRI